MNIMLGRCGFLAGIILSGAAWAGYVRDDFDSYANGDPLSGQWRTTESVIVTNMGARAYSVNNAVRLPVLQSATNVVTNTLATGVVWSDFWTVPRPFDSTTDTAPAVDTNATAQFFVNTNGYWVAIFGRSNAGPSYVTVTNVFTKDVYGADTSLFQNNGTSWWHISVCHNYSNKVWSLFVQGTPIATNLGFINTNVPNYQWFAVENGGGTNETFLDSVSITNGIPSTLTGTGTNGLRDAWELTYYGTIDGSGLNPTNLLPDGYTIAQKSIMGSDPTVSNTTPPAVYAQGGIPDAKITQLGTNAASPTALGMSLKVGTNVICMILSSTSPTGPFTNVVAQFNTGMSAESNSFVDTQGTARAGDKLYYQMRSISADGAVTNISPITFAAVEQARTAPSLPYSYWVGIPVQYLTGSNNLKSLLGQQLAQGLTAGTLYGNSDHITIYTSSGKTSFWLSASIGWQVNPTGLADFEVQPGQGIVIDKFYSSASTQAVFTGQTVTNSSSDIKIMPGWSVMCWPFSVTTNGPSALGLSAAEFHGDNSDALSDSIYLDNRFGQIPGRTEPIVQLRLWADGVWRYVYGSQDASSLLLQPGSGFFVRHRVSTTNDWYVTNPAQ